MRPGALVVTRARVQTVERDVIHLALPGRVALLPASMLPDGLHVGEWVELRIKAIASSVTQVEERPRLRAMGGRDVDL